MAKKPDPKKKQSKANKEKVELKEHKYRPKLIAASLLLFAIALFFALTSFEINDYNVLSGGKSSESWLPSNDLGIIGTYISYFCFRYIGGVSYILVLFLAIGGFKQLFFKSKLYNWEYFLGLFLLTMGLALIFGIYPDSLSNPIDAQLAGGTIGQRWCHPESPIGWIYQFANKTGCLLISGFIFLVGFSIIWAHDWHASTVKFFKSIYNHMTADRPKKEKVIKEPKVKKEKVPKNNRKKDNKPESIFSKLNPNPRTNAPAPHQPSFDN
ncbi:MAG: DNA translocase FtsK 4TM domain-containing protein, partial [Lentisphaeria bacterium]|nr:DNA translocase FtsK 4TM domain-containing protein [Lentisphaeria bacterium]